jgi:hypothetical protein
MNEFGKAARSFWELHGDDVMWVVEKLVFLLLIAAGLLLLLRFFVGWGDSIQLEREVNIAQCMRAFEYTRDQCEFIIRNHVVPR